ncbi:hypothetical protein [Flavihumibacter fluvii]|uniref:hypothetical protein n=1 Tax=Flavihumibacter fluvii TaxID=2838157 RepID=UPI001BDED05E|nr:hypothetical protein [Flavihumibacter fluvii]ULQ54722.1 hypothetical protein KJS93_10370 [Flavihumibacter fluvii]
MKAMVVKYLKIIILFHLSFVTSCLYAQTIEEQMSKSHPDCQTMLMNAMDVLPGLYRKKSLDSLDKALGIWERSCYGMPEVSITRMLLDMEEDKFSLSQDTNGATLDLLTGYAGDFPSPARSEAPKNSFYKFSAAWARLLLKEKKLDKNEIFICRVLSGEINNPRKEIEKNRSNYPEFAAMLKNELAAERKGPRFDLALSTGVWLPTGNLSTLGVHPSFGFHAGLRDMHHQLDLTMQIRYLHSANPYAVKRGGQLDSTDYYFGGYIGLDYNYYLVSTARYDFGLLAGIGWDGFDFAPDPYEYYYYEPYYTSHVTIGSFNANAGLRFNYYVTHSFYIGLQARYNAIQYSTGGGTNLSGDAFSIDLIFGSNSSKY